MINKEELMKKFELARVGNGTQTYNDVVLTLTKEETLELLKYIEKLEKENLKLSIENHNSKIVEEMNKTVVENKNKQLLETTELNITYLDKIIILKKAIKLLKDWFRFKVTKFNNLDGTFRYVLEYEVGLSGYGIILTQEQYELLKRVFESVGEK